MQLHGCVLAQGYTGAYNWVITAVISSLKLQVLWGVQKLALSFCPPFWGSSLGRPLVYIFHFSLIGFKRIHIQEYFA